MKKKMTRMLVVVAAAGVLFQFGCLPGGIGTGIVFGIGDTIGASLAGAIPGLNDLITGLAPAGG